MNAKRLLRSFVLAILLVAIALPLACGAATSPPTGRRVVGYFTEWGIYDRNYLVKDIVASGSAEMLTVINYAFANVVPADGTGPSSGIVARLGDEWADYQKPWTAAQSVDGQAVTSPSPLLGNLQQLKALKGQHPNIKVLISLGGWTWSRWFSDAALTEDSRRAFVASCIDLFIEGNLPGGGGMGGPGAAAGIFDGIDVDWEYPAAEGNPGNIYRPDDTANFTLLLQEFRRQLDAVRPGLLLTIAAPAGPSNYQKLELGKIHKYVDFINLMTYDLHGPWETTTNFASNLYATKADPSRPQTSVDATVQAYLQAGVPAGKLVVGVPFYGHGWAGVTDEHEGLYQPAAGVAPGSWEAGSDDYKVLAGQLAAGSTTRYWSDEAKAPWLFDGSTFWTYDDPQALCFKTSYIRHNQLGGVMFWELSGDTADGALISAIASGLQQPGQGPAGGRCKE